MSGGYGGITGSCPRKIAPILASTRASRTVLHLIGDSEDPYAIVARLVGAVPSGSYLAISHPAIDIHAAQAEAQRRYNERVSTPQTPRTHEQVSRFFDGLDLVPPGVVYVHTWRPDPGDDVPGDATSAHGGVARKP
jgi:S-adenosyl methyltransferase